MSTQAIDLFADRRARFRHYDSPGAVTAYLERLANGWPERPQIAQHIAQTISELAQDKPRVLELCCGPGWLAAQLLTALPTVHYTGVDLSPPFLAFTREELVLQANRVNLLEVDLSQVDWPDQITTQDGPPQFDAIISLQSLHDVGDETAIARLYGLAKGLLAPGGLFLNADLVVPVGEQRPDNPGRLPIVRHLELLTAQGYQSPQCTMAVGNFGCVVGRQGIRGRS